MFDILTESFTKTLKVISGKSKLTDSNIRSVLKEIRNTLLDADVSLQVTKDFIAKVRARALGKEVQSSLSPSQAFIKIVKSELTFIMDSTDKDLNLSSQPPAVILMAGLQGVGKTTTVAKLGRWITQVQKKSVMVVSADVYRPAAIDQLEKLASEQQLQFFPTDLKRSPIDTIANAIQEAKINNIEVLIVDTAGRLHVDEAMMQEIQQIHATANPTETLFVVDAMTGQDAVNVAEEFNKALPLTGVVLAKADADSRGGAALSVRYITGKPIKFMGVGESADALEKFHAERIASRILGMGDILSLIEEIEQKVDKQKAEKLAKKAVKGKGFDLDDFREQLVQMRGIGNFDSLIQKLPGNVSNFSSQAGKKSITQMEAIINSMTPDERKDPDIIQGSRKRRISAGSGTQVQDINRLLKQHKQMSKMMKKAGKKGGMNKIMRGINAMQGNIPGFSNKISSISNLLSSNKR
jgi:signal recognition particle subunit SRP54